MKNIDLEDLLGSEPIEDVKLDIEQVKLNVPLYDNFKLCEIIICDRYFGFGEKIAPICMEELAKRRMAGDTFDFEGYIIKAQKELPVLDFTMPDIRTVLQQAISGKIK
jgi:hypothetical protein